MPKFKTAYGNNPRQKFATRGPSRTHQSEVAQCDINTIMSKYEKTGILSHTTSFEPHFADFTDTPTDYQESMNAVIEADEMFSQLPAKIRRRFHNNAGAFIDFAADPDNADEMVRLGLAKKPAEPAISAKADHTPQKPKEPSKAPPKPAEGEKPTEE